MRSVKRLGDILIDRGYVSRDGISVAMELAVKEGMRIGEACMRLKLIDEDKFAQAIAEQSGLDVVSLADVRLDEDCMHQIPSEMLHKAKAAPVIINEAYHVVTTDPSDTVNLDMLMRFMDDNGMRRGKVAVVPVSEMERLLSRSEYSTSVLKDASSDITKEGNEGAADHDNVLTIDKISNADSPVVRLVDSIIYDAVTRTVSDIHLETGQDGLQVKYRLDGVLKNAMEPVEKSKSASVISRIKVISDLDISERRIPQDGRFKAKIKGKSIDFRVSIMPSIHGEDAVIRILDKGHITRGMDELRLESLGFRDRELKLFRRFIREPYGMILVTGPTGSGKTTTLYAALSEINTGDDKIITIEDPVEYQLKGVVQIAVNEKKGLTFAKGLRSVLRHDPDKILVGEIRDAETAQIAIQAALTGHLVFTTVHANSVFDVIGRFIHMGIEPYNFVSSLNCIAAQRLVRCVCESCKKPVKADEKTAMELGGDYAKYINAALYEGAGCEDCHFTGYKGRKVVSELLDLSDDLRDLISSKQPISAIKKKAAEEGMVTLRQSAIDAVLRGETTVKEINRVTFMET